jgi:hypothetical protein
MHNRRREHGVLLMPHQLSSALVWVLVFISLVHYTVLDSPMSPFICYVRCWERNNYVYGNLTIYDTIYKFYSYVRRIGKRKFDQPPWLFFDLKDSNFVTRLDSPAYHVHPKLVMPSCSQTFSEHTLQDKNKLFLYKIGRIDIYISTENWIQMYIHI